MLSKPNLHRALRMNFSTAIATVEQLDLNVFHIAPEQIRIPLLLYVFNKQLNELIPFY